MSPIQVRQQVVGLNVGLEYLKAAPSLRYLYIGDVAMSDQAIDQLKSSGILVVRR